MKMVIIPGKIIIENVSGVLQFGNAQIISPVSASKTVTGSGSSITGDNASTYNLISSVLVNKQLKTQRKLSKNTE